MNRHCSLIAAFVSASMLAACSSGSSVGEAEFSDADRRLKSFDDGAAFYDALKQALVAQAADQPYDLGVPTTEDTAVLPNAPPAAAPEAGDSLGNSDGATGGGSTENEVTGTNVQEQGVDEQDWVKVSSDGSLLYVLDTVYGNYFPGIEPLPVEPALDEPLSTSIPAPQTAQTTLRILSLDVDAPDATSLNEFSVDLNGRSAEGAYLYETDAGDSVFITASGGGFWGYWDDSTAFAGQNSVITQVDVSNSAAPSVTGSFMLDGQIVSSRRIGKHLFFASRYYPALPGEQPWTQSAEEVQRQLEETELSSLLPQYTLGGSDESTALVDPGECFVARQPDNASYYSPDIITLGVIDLDTLELTDSECYLGASETLYASPNAVFLATTQYDYSTQPVAEDGLVIDVENGEFPGDSVWFDPRVDTDIHQFTINNGQLAYAGSGAVRGHLGWNPLRKPFRMSEHDGYLRVATFNDRQGVDQSPILMAILKADGSGRLNTVAALPNDSEPGFIGKPGEQLYASRFLGDRAYLVTFRQTDPLYIVDLSDPTSPRVAGELEIEGYSDYLHPVGEDYLLGIGKDAVAAPDGGRGDGRGALVQGVKLSLFNVSNPAEPTEVQSLVVGQRGTHSQALEDHRAITVQPATESHPLRVSIGIDVNGQTFPDVPTPAASAFTYYPWSYSGLHGFEVQVGADAGIVSRGSLVVDRASSNNNPYYNFYGRDRSVMVNDSVFYIRGSSVYAAPWDDLANPTPAR